VCNTIALLYATFAAQTQTMSMETHASFSFIKKIILFIKLKIIVETTDLMVINKF
jgi:hypothetical protein